MERKIIELDKKINYIKRLLLCKPVIIANNDDTYSIIDYCLNCEKFFIKEQNATSLDEFVVDDDSCENCNTNCCINTDRIYTNLVLDYSSCIKYSYITRIEYDEYMFKMEGISKEIDFTITEDKDTNEISINKDNVITNNLCFTIERTKNKRGEKYKVTHLLLCNGEKLTWNKRNRCELFNCLVNGKELLANDITAMYLYPFRNNYNDDFIYSIYNRYKNNPDIIGTPYALINKDCSDIEYNIFKENLLNDDYKNRILNYINEHKKFYIYENNMLFTTNNFLHVFPYINSRYYEIKEVVNNILAAFNQYIAEYRMNELYDFLFKTEYTDQEIQLLIQSIDAQGCSYNFFNNYKDYYELCKKANIPFNKLPKDIVIYEQEFQAIKQIVNYNINYINNPVEKLNNNEYITDIYKILHYIYYIDDKHMTLKKLLYLNYHVSISIFIAMEKNTNKILLFIPDNDEPLGYLTKDISMTDIKELIRKATEFAKGVVA